MPAARLEGTVLRAARRQRGKARQPETGMTITISHLQPIIAILAGILILIMPRLLNYIVAFYLIAAGLIGLGIFRG